jgi:hypothetical protein
MEFYVFNLTDDLDLSLTSGLNEMTPELIDLLYSFLSIYGSRVLHNPMHSRWDSLDGASAHRKTSTYIQDNTKNKRTQTSIP